MRKLSVRLTSILLLAASFCAGQEIRTVVAEGVGSDPQSAAQDAAQNALTNVVGSFIDANKQLEKRSEIRDGIRSQTKQIRTDIKEYSQGSIQSFEIVESRKDGIFFRVTAKVGVRVADFRAYVKKLAEGETSVGSGLFAEMSTTQKQSGSLAKILSERILAVVNGEVVRFSVSKPVPFRRSRFADVERENGEAGVNIVGHSDIRRLSQRFSPDQLAVFEVTATLDDAFLANLVQTLDSVAASKQRVPIVVDYADTPRSSVPDCADHHSKGDSSFCLPLLDSNPGTATVYRFSNVDHELAGYLPWGRNGLSYVGSKLKAVPNLEVAVLDKDKRELQVELVYGMSWQGPDKNGRTALEMMKPWLLYAPPPGDQFGAILMRQRTFSVVMKIDDAALRQADSIRVKLVK